MKKRKTLFLFAFVFCFPPLPPLSLADKYYKAMRARWTRQLEKALLDALLSEADKERCNGQAFKKESWENTIRAVNALLPPGAIMASIPPTLVLWYLKRRRVYRML